MPLALAEHKLQTRCSRQARPNFGIFWVWPDLAWPYLAWPRTVRRDTLGEAGLLTENRGDKGLHVL